MERLLFYLTDYVIPTLPQQLFNGLTTGGIYGLMALGMTLIFGILNMMNFAHGVFYMLGAFIVFFSIEMLGANIFIAIMIAFVIMTFLGFGIERGVFKRLWGSEPLTLMIASTGLWLVIENVGLFIWGPNARMYPEIGFSNEPIDVNFLNMSFVITSQKIFIIIVCLTMSALVYLGLMKTKIGVAIRAVVQNKDAAILMGINVSLVYSLVFALGTGLAGFAGAVNGSITALGVTMGTLPLLRSFVAVIIGGLGNVPGAVFAGLMMGQIESLGAAYISTGYKDAIVYGMLIVLLIFKPEGLFGGKKNEV